MLSEEIFPNLFDVVTHTVYSECESKVGRLANAVPFILYRGGSFNVLLSALVFILKESMSFASSYNK